MAVQSLRFPATDESEWWRIMGADIETILEIANQIIELYEIPKVYIIILPSYKRMLTNIFHVAELASPFVG